MSSSNQKGSLFKQFADFLKTFGVIGLAIAFVIGAASSTLVNSVVTDIINPTIGIFLPAGSLTNMTYVIHGISGKPSVFRYGDLVSEIINFLIIAFIVFLAYKELSKFKLVDDKTLNKQ